MSRKFTLPAVLAALMTPSTAFAQAADPAGSGPIVAALGWLQGTLLGNVATAVAGLAVAAVIDEARRPQPTLLPSPEPAALHPQTVSLRP